MEARLLKTHLVGHLDQLRGSANRGTGDDAAILKNLCSFNNGDIEVSVFSIFGVKALQNKKKEKTRSVQARV